MDHIIYPSNKQSYKLKQFVLSDLYIDGEMIKEIPDTHSQYFVTDHGRIISLAYNKARVLKPYICGYGYYYVDLFGKNKRLHILVAKAFLPNPDNKPIVHHKDGNKLNNHVSNLAWLTDKEHGEKHRIKNNG